jgi:hypothetical protein
LHVEISADGSLLAVSHCKGQGLAQFDVYETISGRLVARSPRHWRVVAASAFSPVSPFIACATAQDTRAFAPGESRAELPDEIDPPAVHFWNYLTGAEVERFTGFLGEPTDVAFSPDGRRIVTSHSDSTCLFWPAPQPPESARPVLEDLFWADLSAEPLVAHVAMLRLVEAGDRGVEFLAARMQPAAPPDEELVGRLIADLDADDFATRQQATAGLRKLGPGVSEALRRAAAESGSGEQVGRCRQLLTEFREAFLSDPDQLRHVRAVQAVARIGTPAARSLLARFADGAPSAVLTRHARQALGDRDRMDAVDNRQPD